MACIEWMRSDWSPAFVGREDAGLCSVLWVWGQLDRYGLLGVVPIRFVVCGSDEVGSLLAGDGVVLAGHVFDGAGSGLLRNQARRR